MVIQKNHQSAKKGRAMRKKLYAGIDIGATNVKYGLVDAGGRIIYRAQTTTPKKAAAQKLFECVLRCGEQLLVEADEQNGEVEYIGVGSPGSVNIKTGVIQGTCPNIPGWAGFHLRDRLYERLNLPVMLDNDANCATLAEHRFGAGRGYYNIICLTIGTGIGGGLIVDGRLYRGVNYSAGEIGHMIIRDSDMNKEGQFLESLVSSRAILVRLREKLSGNITPVFKALIGDDLDKLTIKKMYRAIKKGDRIAPETLQLTGQILGTALAGLVNVLNPEVVILGGGVAEGDSEFVDIVKRSIFDEALACATETLAVVPAGLGNAAGFIGAAFLGEEETIEPAYK
jgi:glucokinase